MTHVFQNLLVGTEEEDWFIGDEVQKNRGKLNLHYPIFRGAINWDHLEKVGLFTGPTAAVAQRKGSLVVSHSLQMAHHSPHHKSLESGGLTFRFSSAAY